MSEITHVINPLTGRQIKVGGAMYKKLMKDGVLVNQPYEPEPEVKKVKTSPTGVRSTKKKKKVDSAEHARRASAREKKKREVLRKREILREKKKLQKALEKEKKKKQKMLRKQEEKLKRQREAFEAKQRIARETDFRRQMKLQAKENEKRLRQELNKQAKKKASGVFSKILLENLEELIESEDLECTINELLESSFDLSEPQVAEMTNVLVQKTEELKTEIHPFRERSEGGEGAVEEVADMTPSGEELTSSEEEESEDSPSGSETSEEEEEEVEEVEEEDDDDANFL